jgi:hypothetical protein
VGNNTKNSSLKQTPSNMDSRETIQKIALKNKHLQTWIVEKQYKK